MKYNVRPVMGCNVREKNTKIYMHCSISTSILTLPMHIALIWLAVASRPYFKKRLHITGCKIFRSTVSNVLENS